MKGVRADEPISRGRTVTFDIVEYFTNGMDNTEWKSNIQDMQEGAYP